MAYDGSIKFGIEVDDDKLKSALEELKKLMESAGDATEKEKLQFNKLVNEAERYSAQLEKHKRAIDLTNTALQDKYSLTKELQNQQQGLSALQEEMNTIKKLREERKITGNEMIAQLSRAENKYSEIEKTIERIKEEQKDLGSFEKLNQSLEQSKDRLASMEYNMQKTMVSTNELSDVFEARILKDQEEALAKAEEILGIKQNEVDVTEEVANATIEVNENIKESANKAQNVKEEIKEGSDNANKLSRETGKVSESLRESSKQANRMGNNIGSGFKKVTRYALALFGIRSIYGMLSKLSREWINSNDEGARQMNANIQAMSNGLSQALAPVLKMIMGWVTTLMGYVNALTKAFFGVELFSAKTNKNIKGATGNAKKLGKEVKKFSASFDEADVASESIADNLDSGAGGAGGMDLPQPSIPTPDISGILGALNKVKEFWLGIWNSDVIQALMNLVSAVIVNSIESAISIAGNLWGNLVETWYAMLPDLTRGFDALQEYWTNVFNDMADAINKWAPIITESINDVIDSIFDTFRPMFVWLAGEWADIAEFMVETWDKYGAEILDNIGELINGIIETVGLIWTEIIDPIVTPFLEELKRLWDEYLKDIVYDVIDFVGEMVLRFLEVWNKAIKPFIDKMITIFGPILSGVFTMLSSIVGGVLGGMLHTFKGLWEGFKEILRGLLTFIEGVFTGNWRKVWEGVKQIVGGVFQGMLALVKAPLNIIIGMVNGLIRGLNRIKLPGWVPGIGGKGINIGTIPYLAKGGVLNRPTLNVAGEAGKEAVVPLENNTDWAKDFLGVLDQYGGFGGGQQVIQVVMPNGKVLAEVVNDEREKANLQRNGGWFAWNG